MCAVNTVTTFNRFDYPPAAQQSAERRAAAGQRHFLGGPLNLPSIVNLFFVPSDVLASARDQVQAEKTSDVEGTRDNCLRLIEAPINAVSSGFSNIEIVTKILSYFEVVSTQLAVLSSVLKKLPILGLFICSIEVLLEGSGFKRAMALRSALALPDSSLRGNKLSSAQIKSLMFLYNKYCDRDPAIIDQIEDLVQRKYPTMTAKERGEKVREYETLTWGAKDRQLIRRLYPRCAQEVQEKVPQLLHKIAAGKYLNEKEWRQEASELLSDVKMQLNKKIAMHLVGLLAIALTIAGSIAILCACPYTIPFALLIVGGVLSTGRFGMDAGMMDVKGYHFSFTNLLPDCLKPSYQKTKAVFMQCAHSERRDKVDFLLVL